MIFGLSVTGNNPEMFYIIFINCYKQKKSVKLSGVPEFLFRLVDEMSRLLLNVEK